MNWKEIKETCPLAYDMFVYGDVEQIYVTKNYEPIRSMESDTPFNIRELYDFFDENLIMIEIGVDFTRVGYGSPLFAFCVSEFAEHKNDNPELYRSRQEAEEVAFTEAFKILNNKQ